MVLPNTLFLRTLLRMGKPYDFFISYTGKDKAWAEWIAWTLEDKGYKTLIQAWDFKAASNFVAKMQEGAVESVRTIAVLSPEYFKSAFTQPEWYVAFASDPKSEQGKLIPVRVVDFVPPGYFSTIAHIDLAGVEEAAAQEKLVKSIGSIVDGTRLKPATPPAFPGSPAQGASAARPAFPGTAVQRKPLHNLPFSPNPSFTGRERLLEKLQKALHHQTAAAITQPQAVHGLGGVGKTQLAVQYAWAHIAEYDAILWAGASSPSDLLANIATLATVLRLPEAAAREQEVRVAAVAGWLQSNPRWLLILDNADTLEARQAVEALLPPGLQGQVIVTSRLAGWPNGFAHLEVRVLSPEAAEKFFQDRAASVHLKAGTDADARVLAGELGFLPLALEQAAAFLVYKKVTFAEYRRRLAESRGKLLEFPSKGGTGYQKTVTTTWLVTESQLSPRARTVLQLAALLAPDEIPRAMFTQGGKVIEQAMKLLPESAGVLQEPGGGGPEPAPSPGPSEQSLAPVSADQDGHADAVDDALAELSGYSLVDLAPDGFALHRLLQAVLSDRLAPAVRQAWVDHAVQLVNDFAPEPSDDVRNWPVWDRVRPHAAASLKEAAGQANRGAAALMNGLGMLLMGKALYGEAERFLCRSLALAERSCGVEHPDVATGLNNLALLLQDTNRLAEAEPMMRRALAIDEKSFGTGHPSVARDINNLAGLLMATNRPAEAEPLMRRALAIAEKSYAMEHPKVAICLMNIAQLFKDTNRLGEAEQMMRRALAIDERSYGPEHPDVATDLNNLGQLLKDTNRLGEAEQMMCRALAIDERSYGPEHPDVATDLNNLALLLDATSRLPEAVNLMCRAKEIRGRSLGPDHPRTKQSKASLARMQAELGQRGE